MDVRGFGFGFLEEGRVRSGTYSFTLDLLVSALRFSFACACARLFTWCRFAVGVCG